MKAPDAPAPAAPAPAVSKDSIDVKLDDFEIEQARQIGRLCTYADGEYLFRSGDNAVNFCIILDGEVSIVDDDCGDEALIVTHSAKSFTGEIDVLRGRPAIVSGRALGEATVVNLTADEMRELMIRCSSLGDKILGAIQSRRAALEGTGLGSVYIIGEKDSSETLRLREFLHRNDVLHSWKCPHLEETQVAMKNLGHTRDDLPVLVARGGKSFANPHITEIAAAVGIQREFSTETYDTVIVGSGPAGLGAAVYASSEGLKTVVIDKIGPGGQAGSSSKIENYAGFPSGLSGQELALRAQLQASKFGAEITAPCSAKEITRRDDGIYEIVTCLDTTITTKTIIIATGVGYRALTVNGLDAFRDRGVYYSATKVESVLCSDRPVHIVGAGNSAGQAAMYLSSFASSVKLLVRGDNLEKSMSEYLSSRVHANQNIEVAFHTELHGVIGETTLEKIQLNNNTDDSVTEEESGGIFIFIGAKPATDFLDSDQVQLDEKGFILAGAQVKESPLWQDEDREPCALETSAPGIFVAGDCRSGTTKRVAFAIGDGALAVTCVHEFLGTYS